MADTDQAQGLTSTQLAAHIEALNLTGLSFCVRRLLGKDPQPVSGQFTMWARQDRKGLPGVTQGLWSVLAPLRIGRPQSPAAAVCDQVLKGRERDGSVALKAAADSAAEGKTRFRPLPAGLAASAPQQKALVDAVKNYWRTVGTMYGEVRTPVVEGDLQRAVQRIRGAEQTLRAVVERIADLAGELGDGAAPDVVADIEPDQVSAVARTTPVAEEAELVGTTAWADDPGYAPVDAEGCEPAPPTGPLRATGPLRRTAEDDRDVADPVAARAEAFARQQRLREETPPEPLPVEVLSTKPVRNHVFLPIVFLLITAGLAMYVIFSVLNAPNPLTQ